jgi:hypothetical protein
MGVGVGVGAGTVGADPPHEARIKQLTTSRVHRLVGEGLCE